MKISKKGFIIVLLLIIAIPTWFAAKKCLLSRYVYDGNTLVYKNDIYIYSRSFTVADEVHAGKPIGIAVHKNEKVTLAEIFTFSDTVYEFKDDKEHNYIFIKMFVNCKSNSDEST